MKQAQLLIDAGNTQAMSLLEQVNIGVVQLSTQIVKQCVRNWTTDLYQCQRFSNTMPKRC